MLYVTQLKNRIIEYYSGYFCTREAMAYGTYTFFKQTRIFQRANVEKNQSNLHGNICQCMIYSTPLPIVKFPGCYPAGLLSLDIFVNCD